VLNGPEQLEWRDALFNAFSFQEFSDLLLYRLNERIDKYTTLLKLFQTVVGDVVSAFSMRDWEGKLIVAAIEARPGNAALLRLARHGFKNLTEDQQVSLRDALLFQEGTPIHDSDAGRVSIKEELLKRLPNTRMA
jgi:hypothetical protein